jgi:hypothetical protein
VNAGPDDVAADAFECVNCGAAVTFRDTATEGDAPELERATCAYCNVINDRALAMLRKQRARERHVELVAEKRQASVLLLIGTTLAVVVGLMAIAAFSTREELATAQASVERQRAQVRNVVERREAVVKRFAHASPGPDRDAELSGAENRVRIERARYDEAAATYNAAASSPWARACARLFDLPERLPLSNEAQW